MTSFECRGGDRHWRKIGNMDSTDPYRQEIVRELRVFRKGAGEPGTNRMASLFYLTEALGEGVPERAFAELGRLRERFGRDPLDPIGAYFFLAGWGVGLGTVDERRRLYVQRHYAGDISTPWRRAEKGIVELLALIRDRDESHRPIASIDIIPGGLSFQTALGFEYAPAPWTKPRVYINGEEYDLDRYVNTKFDGGNMGRQFILPFVPLDASVGALDSMGTVRVTWQTATWPVWSVVSSLDDRRMFTQTRTFAHRSIEVSIRSAVVQGHPPGRILGERAALAHKLMRWDDGGKSF